MKTAQSEIEADGPNITQQPNSELLPFMETVRFEVESSRGELKAVRAENQRLHIQLGNFESEKNHLDKNWWKFDHNLRQNAPHVRKLQT
jgi:predicted nuclease with TOPRIM domain